MTASKRYRLGIVLSHPVEHFAPFFRRLARERDLDVHVFYYSTQGVELSHDDEFGVQYKWDIPLTDGYDHTFLPTWRGKISPVVSGWSLNPAIWSGIGRGRFDAILFYGWHRLSNWIGFMACAWSGTPMFLIGDTTRERNHSKPFQWGRALALRWLFGHAAAFLVTSGGNRRFYGRYGVSEARQFFVPLSPDLGRFKSAHAVGPETRLHARQRHGLPADAPLILFVGKLVPRKGVLDLVKAFGQVQKRCRTDAGLVLVGEGVERSSVEEYVKANGLASVFLLGFMNQSEIPAIYCASDIFVVPSEFDPNPLVVLEAMACGLPCVLSDAVGRYGADEPVCPDDNGFVYPYGDVAKLAGYLERLLADASLRFRMGEASLRRVEGWDYEAGVRGVLDALRFVGEESRSR